MATRFSVPTGVVHHWLTQRQVLLGARAILCAQAHRPGLNVTTEKIIRHSRIAAHPVLSGLEARRRGTK